MSQQLTPSGAISRIPGWAVGDAHIVARLDGLTNRTYQLEYRGETFALRLHAGHTDLFGIDRERERRIHETAAAAGLAPKIVFADTNDGILLTRYIRHRTLTRDDLRNNEHVEAIAQLLTRVHALPDSGYPFEKTAAAKRYLEAIPAGDARFRTAARYFETVGESAPDSPLCCCHNDVVAANVIGGEQMMLVDWEYACDNDPLFDLASLIGYHNFDAKQSDVLLDAYTGGSTAELRERLADQRRIYDALQWLWFAARGAHVEDRQ